MTDEDKKRIFEYMGWIYHHMLDEYDMILAMNNAKEKEDWGKFMYFVKLNLPHDVTFIEDIIHYLMQPARFFELMLSWLKEKEHENSRT